MLKIANCLLIFTVNLIAGIFLFTCTGLNGPDTLAGTSVISGGNAIVKIAAAKGSPFSMLAKNAMATISASDILPWSKSLVITESGIAGIIEDIPAGKDRQIEINVYDSNQVLQYSGSTFFDVRAGLTVSVTIDVFRVKGNAQINGAIIENVPLNSELVAIYAFSGTARDGTDNFNDGIATGATLTTDRFGKENCAYWFDGVDDYIEVAYDKTLDCEDSVSVVLWAKSDIPGTAYTESGVVFQIGDGAENAYTIYLDETRDVMLLQFRNHGKMENNQIVIADGGIRHTVVLDTLWHFYAMSFDGDSLRAYVDGALIGTIIAIPGTITERPLRIGAQSKYIERYWKGKIDDIRIYHRKLSAEEIVAIMSQDG